MAGVDLAYVALELSQLAIGERLRRQVSRFARPAVIGTLIGSAAMNAFAFAAQAANAWMIAAAVTLGRIELPQQCENFGVVERVAPVFS